MWVDLLCIQGNHTLEPNLTLHIKLFETSRQTVLLRVMTNPTYDSVKHTTQTSKQYLKEYCPHYSQVKNPNFNNTAY